MKDIVFGVDIGGTTIKMGMFKGDVNSPENMTLTDKCEIPTNTAEGGKNILGDICLSVNKMLEENGIEKARVYGVGMGIPGPVLDDGRVLGCVNLGFGEINIVKEMESRLPDIIVKAGNDANVAALGEQRFGGGAGYKDVVMITLGTGVGGGIVINGELIAGSNGAAGEIGHMTVNVSETKKCNCGKCGCLEQYASATGIVKLAEKHNMTAMEEITSKYIFEQAKKGDCTAENIVGEFANILGMAMANIAAVVNPQCFVIGGGVSRAGDYLIDNVKKYYEKYAFEKCKNALIKTATLSNDAGIYGAMASVTGRK